MKQPERPDRAASEQSKQDHVAAQLRHAVRSYEPDGDRIRRLIDARTAATGGIPIKSREGRGLGGRAVMWPVVGSAAAAAVILAVAASGAPGGPEQGGNGNVTVSSSPLDGAPAAQDPTALVPPTSSVVPSSPTTVPGTPTPSGSTGAAGGHPGPRASVTVTAAGGAASSPGGPTGPSGGTGRTAAGRSGGSPVPGAPAPVQTSGSVGGRQVTAVVQQIGASGYDVNLGAAGEKWLVASSALGPSQPHSANNLDAIGPVQPLVLGGAVAPGPFRVAWQNGSSSEWLTAPRSAASSPSAVLLRIPVRFKTDTPTVVLYLGTIGGTGRLEIGTSGAGGFSVQLPGCADTCGAIVTITSHGGPGIPTTGDLPVDVFAGTATKVAVAAATLS